MDRSTFVLVLLGAMLVFGVGMGPPWGGGWVWPLADSATERAVISQEFRSPGHLGVDLMFRGAQGFYLPEGRLVVAARDGVVKSTGVTSRGHNVVLAHEGGWMTFYQHLDTVAVKQGQTVSAGDALGLAGIDPTDGGQVRHLHFATWYGGWGDSSSVDPAIAMKAWRRVIAT